jgi:hypothetical protein
MQAYATAYECGNLSLIYPWHSGLIGSKETSFELRTLSGIRSIVSVLCLDLHSDRFSLVRGSSVSEFRNLLIGR